MCDDLGFAITAPPDDEIVGAELSFFMRHDGSRGGKEQKVVATGN
jgi:hypothetical protein